MSQRDRQGISGKLYFLLKFRFEIGMIPGFCPRGQLVNLKLSQV